MTLVTLETVQSILEVAGGIIAATGQIQMACAKAEVTHKELLGSHFED